MPVKLLLNQRRHRKHMDIAERLTSSDRIIGNMLYQEFDLRNRLSNARAAAVIGWLAFAYVAYCCLSAQVGMECQL